MKPQNRESMHKLGKLLYIILTKYPSPGGLNYAWNYGVLGLLALGIQVVTGIVLAMFYTAHIDYAFYSVEHIMRDINLGYILRYTHATGASFFFIVIYAHILRGQVKEQDSKELLPLSEGRINEIKNDFGISLAIITILGFIGSGIALFRGYLNKKKFNAGSAPKDPGVDRAKKDTKEEVEAPHAQNRIIPDDDYRYRLRTQVAQAKTILKKYNQAVDKQLPLWFKMEIIIETIKDIQHPELLQHLADSYVIEITPPVVLRNLYRRVSLTDIYLNDNIYVKYPNATKNINKNVLTLQDVRAYGQREREKLMRRADDLRTQRQNQCAQTPEEEAHSGFYRKTVLIDPIMIFPGKLPRTLPKKIWERVKVDLYTRTNILEHRNNINFFRVWATFDVYDQTVFFCKAASTELGLYLKEVAPGYDFEPFIKWKTAKELDGCFYSSPVPETFFNTPKEKLTCIRELYTHLILRHTVPTNLSSGAKLIANKNDYLYYNLFCWYEDGLLDSKLFDDLVEFTRISTRCTASAARVKITRGFGKLKGDLITDPVVSAELRIRWKTNGTFQKFAEKFSQPGMELYTPKGFIDKIIFYDKSSAAELQERFSKNIFGPEGPSVKETPLFINQIEMSEDLADFDFAALEAVADSNPEISDGALKYLIDFDKKLRGVGDITESQPESGYESESEYYV